MMMKRRWRSTLKVSRNKRFLGLTLCAMLYALSAPGCAHTIEIKDETIKAGKMKAGESYTAPMDGWFISDEGVYMLLHAIEYYRYLWFGCENK